MAGGSATLSTRPKLRAAVLTVALVALTAVGWRAAAQVMGAINNTLVVLEEEGLTAAASDGGQHLMLASQAGRLLSSRDGGAHFTPVKLARPVPASAVLPVGPGAAIVAGARGIAVQTFK